MQTIIELCRKIRDNRKIPLKIPVLEVKVIHRDPNYLDCLNPLIPYIKEELNCFNVSLELERPENVQLTCIPNNEVLGRRLKKQFNKEFKDTVNNLPSDLIAEYEVRKSVMVNGVELGEGDLFVRRSFKGENPDLSAAGDNDAIVVVDCKMNDELLQVGIAREFANRVQKLRKSSGLQVEDEVVLYFSQPGAYFENLLQAQSDLIGGILRIPFVSIAEKLEHQVFISKGELENEEEKIEFSLYWRHPPAQN